MKGVQLAEGGRLPGARVLCGGCCSGGCGRVLDGSGWWSWLLGAGGEHCGVA